MQSGGPGRSASTRAKTELERARDIRLAPIGVMNGMVRLFLALALIEGASLALKYL